VKIILGSGSPRRKSILERIFGAVQVIPPSVDESLLPDEKADEYAERISHLKMDAVVSGLNSDGEYCVITSDTIVCIDGNILGKPDSEGDAYSMLRMLSGKEHFVLTGLCIELKNGVERSRLYDSEKTSVRFKMLSDETVKEYLNLVNYTDKAGSYAIQEHGDLLIESTCGSMSNIIGFPLRLFFRMLISMRGTGIFLK
jgi:septum formation protein